MATTTKHDVKDLALAPEGVTWGGACHSPQVHRFSKQLNKSGNAGWASHIRTEKQNTQILQHLLETQHLSPKHNSVRVL
jgi:hypothetical protein